MSKCPFCEQEIDEDDDAQPCGWPVDKEPPRGYPPCWDVDDKRRPSPKPDPVVHA